MLPFTDKEQFAPIPGETETHFCFTQPAVVVTTTLI